jgi:hypothetical protein
MDDRSISPLPVIAPFNVNANVNNVVNVGRPQSDPPLAAPLTESRVFGYLGGLAHSAPRKLPA